MNITPKQYAISLYETTEGLSEREAKNRIENFVEILKENNHLHLEDKIIEEYYKYYQKKRKVSRITVRSKDKISQDILHSIIKKFDNQVEIKEEIDNNMLGGIKLEIDDNILIDGSIDKKIESIREAIEQ